MIRQKYFNHVEAKLSELVTSIELRGSLNILDKNLFAEDFYKDFCNLLFSWKLKNLNAVDPNATAIDLFDDDKKIVIQVSATATKIKIQSSLNKDLSKYTGYSFKFISI